MTDKHSGYDQLSKSGSLEKSLVLVKDVYITVKSFPKEEVYALTSQIKRAVISMPANIAEGIGRNYKKDTIQFLHIARGSLYELETLLAAANMLEMLDNDRFAKLEIQIKEILKVLNGLITYYEKSDLK